MKEVLKKQFESDDDDDKTSLMLQLTKVLSNSYFKST